MSPNFRPRFMSAAHVPSSTERLMNPFYHSQVRLPPYRARHLQRFHPYPRGSPSGVPGRARDDGDFDSDFEWDEFLKMMDAFQRLEIHSVPRSNNAYVFPDHAANEEQLEPQQRDGHRAASPNAADAVSVETQTIDAAHAQCQSDSNGVIEDSDIVTPTGREGNQGDRSIETGNAVSHALQEASSSTQSVMALAQDCRSVGVVGV